MIPSRGKHREFAQVSTQQSLRSSATHAERRSRTAPFHSSPPPSPSVPPLTFPSLRNLSLLPSRLSYLSAPRSLHSLCLFRVFAVECHNFCESLRFGRRWVETRTANPHQTNRLQKTCREPRRNPRAAALPRRLLPLAHPVRRRAFSTAMSPSLSFFPSRSRASCLAPPCPSLILHPVSLNFITARCRPVSRCNMIVANEKVAKRENRLRVTNVD